MTKAVFNWSGGKDSSLCLYKVLKAGEFDVSHLLTSVNSHYQRISMHGVRVELLEQQAASLNIPLTKILLPEMPDMSEYDKAMSDALQTLKRDGVQAAIFGDIFLEDLRKYREEKLSLLDLKGVFPLWKISTSALAREFIDLGFKAVTVCVNEKYLDQSFVGRVIDHEFLNDLPSNVDPCGEYGEFHSFVYDGPMFTKPIGFTKGEIVYRRYKSPKQDGSSQSYHSNDGDSDPYAYGFWYCDLIPV
ncbi:MAG: diphthine--ammonia ligase [Ignavibacteriales bacterium]|nr:diphthine--ammonia ligase [Ignavibacteriales bacterium]